MSENRGNTSQAPERCEIRRCEIRRCESCHCRHANGCLYPEGPQRVTRPAGAQCAANGTTADGRGYHYSSAHNGYVSGGPER